MAAWPASDWAARVRAGLAEPTRRNRPARRSWSMACWILGRRPGSVLDLVQDRRFLVAAEEAVGLEIRGGGLGGVVEADVSGVRPEGSGEGGLAGLAWAGEEDGREEVEGEAEGGFELARYHLADYPPLQRVLSNHTRHAETAVGRDPRLPVGSVTGKLRLPITLSDRDRRGRRRKLNAGQTPLPACFDSPQSWAYRGASLPRNQSPFIFRVGRTCKREEMTMTRRRFRAVAFAIQVVALGLLIFTSASEAQSVAGTIAGTGSRWDDMALYQQGQKLLHRRSDREPGARLRRTHWPTSPRSPSRRTRRGIR